jgi:hypothetical protein
MKALFLLPILTFFITLPQDPLYTIELDLGVSQKQETFNLMYPTYPEYNFTATTKFIVSF